MKSYTLYILLFTLLLSSCERYSDVEVDIPYKEKVVSFIFLEEGSTEATVVLSSTTPMEIYTPDGRPSYIDDAEVVLNAPGEAVNLVYTGSEGTYKGNLSAGAIAGGESYSLTVNRNNQQVTGSTTVPLGATPVIDMQFDSIAQNEAHTYSAHIKLRIAEPGAHNIMLNVLLVYSDSFSYPMLASPDLNLPVTVLGNGQTMEVTFNSTFASLGIYPRQLIITPQLCDEHYTKYHNSIQSIGFGFVGFPGGEPVMPYTNMSNNLGAIGSYRYLTPIMINLPQ